MHGMPRTRTRSSASSTAFSSTGLVGQMVLVCTLCWLFIHSLNQASATRVTNVYTFMILTKLLCAQSKVNFSLVGHDHSLL